MEPLSIVLVGCDGPLRGLVLGDLARLDATIEDEFDDIPAAVARPVSAVYWMGDTPPPARVRVFVVRLKGHEDFRALEWLRRTYEGEPVVALVGPGEDESAADEARRGGAARVVALPFPPGALRAALEAVRPSAPPAGGPRVIAVAGVAGGCGATTIAVNLACELAAQGRGPCALVELAPRLGKLADFLDLRPEFTLADVLAEGEWLDPHKVQRALTPAGPNLSVLSGPLDRVRLRTYPPADLLRVVELTRRATGVVVVDVPCTYDDVYFGALAGADRVVLVGEQRVPALRAMRLVAGAVAGQTPGREPVLVVNRYDPQLEGFGAHQLGRVLGAAGFVVANDPRNVGDAINRGLPLRRRDPASPALADIAALARELVGPVPTTPTGVPPGGSGVVPGGSGVRRLFQIFRTAT